MIGKKSILLSSLLALFLLASNSLAWTVADPTSHIYLSEQIKQLTSQLENMKAQLDEAVKANDTLMKSYESVSGTYDRVTGVYDDITSTKAFLKDSYNTVMNQYQHYKDLYGDLAAGDIETIKDLLEGIYSDPRTATSEEDRERAEKEYQVQQEAIKKAIDDSESVLESMSDRMSKIQDLGNKIGKSKGTKEAQALTNSLLLEILIVLQEQLAMSTRYQQAMALTNYSGVTEEGIQARAEAMKKIITNEELIAHETKILETLGVNNDASLKDKFNSLM